MCESWHGLNDGAETTESPWFQNRPIRFGSGRGRRGCGEGVCVVGRGLRRVGMCETECEGITYIDGMLWLHLYFGRGDGYM